MQNRLDDDGDGPSPDKILRYLEISGIPSPGFDIEIVEADFLLRTGSA